MNSITRVKYSKYFYGQVKKLGRKFPSLASDLDELQKILIAEPRTGIQLGKNTFKIRLAIKSKGKGKSGGARVISYLETEVIGLVENNKVTLINIYDKSEISSITKEEIQSLIEELPKDKR